MRPKPTSAGCFELFRANFNQILNLDHEICQLAKAINWNHFDAEFADGHTLADAVLQTEGITGKEVKEVFVDQGYKGHNYIGEAIVHITGRRGGKKATATLRKRKKRRAAIKPKIGHLKSDHRMNRNFLKNESGDRVNALLAGIGANLRKLLAAFWRALWQWPTNYASHLSLAILSRNPQLAVAA